MSVWSDFPMATLKKFSCNFGPSIEWPSTLSIRLQSVWQFSDGRQFALIWQPIVENIELKITKKMLWTREKHAESPEKKVRSNLINNIKPSDERRNPMRSLNLARRHLKLCCFFVQCLCLALLLRTSPLPPLLSPYIFFFRFISQSFDYFFETRDCLLDWLGGHVQWFLISLTWNLIATLIRRIRIMNNSFLKII